VALSWAAPEDDGGLPVTGYSVSLDGGAWTDAGAVTSYTFHGLQNGLEYAFSVRAVNGAREGGAAEITLAPLAELAAPSEPRGLEAAPGDRRAVLSWTAPASDGGAAVVRYEASSDGGETWTAETAGTEQSYTFTGLINGREYSFRVRAVNGVGAGGPSECAYATPMTTPSAPQGLRAASGESGVTVSWGAPLDDGGSAVTGYLVAYGDEAWADAAAATSYAFAGLAEGRTYTFRVRAVNAAGDGEIASVTAEHGGAGQGGGDIELAGEAEELPSGDGQEQSGGGGSGDAEKPAQTATSSVRESEASTIAGAAALPPGSLLPDGDGNLRYNTTDAAIIAREVWQDLETAEVTPLPLARAGVSGVGGTVGLSFKMKGAALLAGRPEDVRVMKVKSGARGDSFGYAASRAEFADGRFTVLKGGVIYGGAIEPDTEYTLALFVKDGGEFDLDPAPARILDPAVIVGGAPREAGGGANGESEDSGEKGGGKPGGCNAFPAFAAAAAAVCAIAGKKTRRLFENGK
jgi:hypothetical protein